MVESMAADKQPGMVQAVAEGSHVTPKIQAEKKCEWA